MTLPIIGNLGGLLGGSTSTPIPAGGTYWWAGAFVDSLVGIPSAEAFGTPTLAKLITNVGGIPPGDVGSPLLTYDQTISYTGIDEEGFGEPVVAHAENQIARADGVPSAEAFGTTTLIRGWLLEGIGIESAEAFGATAIPTPPRFDSVGAGWANTTGFGYQFSWSHNGSLSAYVIVDIVVGQPVTSIAVTYGGIAMTQLASVALGAVTSLGPGHYYRYGLANIPGGTQTVAVVFDIHDLSIYASGNSVSYLGVSSISSAQLTAMTQSNSPSQSVTTSSAQLAVQAFGGNNDGAGAPFSSVAGGTNRYNAVSTVAQLSISDSAAAAQTFTATASGSSSHPEYWVGCVHKLLASAPSLDVAGIGSGEAFGTAALVVATPQTLTANALASGEAFGTSVIGSFIVATGIASGEAVGTGGILRPAVSPSGVASGEAFGTSNLGLFLLPTGITSGEAVGSASVAQVASPTGIASGQAFGSATVANASTVAYDAVGAGASTAFNTTVSWSHTATAGATALAFVSIGSQSPVTSVTYGGSAMTLVGSVNFNNNSGFSGHLEVYKLAGVAGGASTVTVNLGNNDTITANSVSLLNVGSVGSPATVFGSSGSPSQTVTLTSQPMSVQGFGIRSGSFSAASGGTNRYRNQQLTISTATATATFTATNSSIEWGGIAVILS